jgi:SRSO17 transposase
VSILNKEKLNFALAIRSNHGVWMPSGQRIRVNKWREFERVFSTGETSKRYIREIIDGKKREIRYWQVTDNKETLPANSTWYIMTKIPKINYKEVGNIYGLRNWVEYGIKQSKNELGWANFRLTDYSRIEKWWEIVMSAYVMVSLQSEQLNQKEMDNGESFIFPNKSIYKFDFGIHLFL